MTIVVQTSFPLALPTYRWCHRFSGAEFGWNIYSSSNDTFDVLVHFGTITSLGILLDTFVVRPLLVPAITTVLGRFAFWPGKL